LPDISDTIETTATDGVQSASADGRSVAAVPIPDLIAAKQFTAGEAAVADTNENGGPRSLWNRLRPGKAVFGGHT
jgi:hypothetical protein